MLTRLFPTERVEMLELVLRQVCRGDVVATIEHFLNNANTGQKIDSSKQELQQKMQPQQPPFSVNRLLNSGEFLQIGNFNFQTQAPHLP